MAVVGPSRHGRGVSSMMQTNQHAILAAAQYYAPPHAHQASTPSGVNHGGEGVSAAGSGLDVQPDRPIGYGAFGVVW